MLWSFYEYQTLKALHIISMTAWMAGLFYLPRLFVYHAECKQGSETAKTFEVMEHKLLRIIMNPAMLLTWALGLSLALQHGGDWFSSNIWFHIKMLLVFILTGFHMYLARIRKDFVASKNRKSSRFYRILNEVPTVLLILIVLLAVVKWPMG